MDEDYRPQFHYTAQKNMINDPNGLVYYDGEYHLFHQYNQHDVVHWGHAVSADLVHWRHLPPAIYPDLHGQVYSGTAIVDWHNSSGLKTSVDAVIIAFFTHADHADGTQSQGLAFSNDRGRTWTMHDRNPLLANPTQKDFRDPKVLRHEATDSWIMVVAAGDHLEFFRSTNLLDWSYAASWGDKHGCHDGVWECPDLFELPVMGQETTKWVVSVSVARGAPAGGSGMQYFVGDFDGQTFLNDNPPDAVLWQNWGKDYYAGITWENVPDFDGRRLMVAWADNWQYRFDLPTTPFNGQLTIVRELRLEQTATGLRLCQSPAKEIELLRGPPTVWNRAVLHSLQEIEPTDLGDAYEVLVTFDVEGSSAAEYGVELRVGRDEGTRVGYDPARQVAFLDRTGSGLSPHPEFPGRHEAPMPPVDGRVAFRIFVDRSSVEVFLNEREQITDLILPSPESTGFRPFVVDGHAEILSMTTYPLESIWSDQLEPMRQVLSGEWASTTLGIQGSSSDVAVAVVDPSTTHETAGWIVQLIGTRDGNPTRMLGEAAAGIVVDYDERDGDGMLVLLDRERQGVTVRGLRDSADAGATRAFSIDTNREYLVRVDWTPDGGAISVDGQLCGPLVAPAREGGATALYVENAEALFRRQLVTDLGCHAGETGAATLLPTIRSGLRWTTAGSEVGIGESR